MLAAATSLGGCCPDIEPSLRSKFSARRPILEKLVAMARSDKSVVRVAPSFTRLVDDWSWPRAANHLGFSGARWDEYRHLFEQAGIKDGIEWQGEELFFYAQGCGLSVSGLSRGYVYSANRPATIVQTLRSLPEDIGYIELGGGWYIFQWNL